MDKPPVVIIMLDALRGDCVPGAAESPHLRSLGLRRPEMAALSDMVQGCSLFTQAMSCSGYTTPCVGSIFTGLLPPEHGVRAFDLTALSTDVRTLAEILAAAGYATCAMTDQPPVLQPMGLLRGFQATAVNDDEAMAWWDSFAGKPRFLFMHLWDAHKPYGMPFAPGYRAAYPAIVSEWQERLRSKGIAEPQGSSFLDEDEQRQRVYRMQFAWEGAQGFRAGLATYLLGLQTFDHGRLHDLSRAFAAHHVANEAIFVLLADHGEGRDRPPSWRMTHDASLADDIMHIPLYVRVPGLHPRRVTEQVSEVDITPTVLDLLGMAGERTAPRSSYNGRSLLPLLRGQALPVRPAYAEVSKLNNDPTSAVAQSGGTRVTTLHARVLRHEKRKYRLAGQPFMVSEELLSAPADEFVRQVCRNLLGRIETPDDSVVWRPMLESPQKRQTLLRSIEESDECRLLAKYAMYDLLSDPLEIKPLDARSRPHLWDEYKQQVAIMQEIDACARPGEALLTSQADEQIILKRLQDLGYVE